MKDYLLLLVKYNREADNKMLKILEEMTNDDRNADRKSYFKSLHGILDHMAAVGAVYQARIKASYRLLDGLSNKYSEYSMDFGKINFTDFSELASAVRILDDSYIKAVNSIEEEELNNTLTFTTKSGVVTLTLGVFLLRYINHGTHHRGQISQILDELAIDNNFSIIEPSYE